MSPVIFAIVSVVLSAMAQLALKSGMSAPGIQGVIRSGDGIPQILVAASSNGMVIIGFALYAIGAGVWLLVLGRWEVSKAYPFVGLGFVMTMVFGAALLGERITPERAFGTLLVLGGVLLVGRT